MGGSLGGGGAGNEGQGLALVGVLAPSTHQCPPHRGPSPPASCPQCNQFFDLLQDLVDHVNDFHVKPEKDAGYCCHWEGCARHGRGFNARWAKEGAPGIGRGL